MGGRLGADRPGGVILSSWYTNSEAPRDQERAIEQPIQEDLIDSRIEVHDSNQFEVKLDYTIAPEARHNRYHIAAYFFIPKSLGLNAHTYGRDQFYSDIQAYIRFKTPAFSLRALLDSKNEHSPLNQIEALLEQMQRNPRDADSQHELSHELRLLGCLIRGNLRNRLSGMRDKVGGLSRSDAASAVIAAHLQSEGQALLDELLAVVSRTRNLRNRFMDPMTPAWVRETYAFVDEYISVTVEDNLTLLVDHIDSARSRFMGNSFDRGVVVTRNRLADFISQEQRHRAACRYTTVLDTREHGNERYIYRRSLLKKFVMSVLFLEISKEKEGRRVGDVSAAIAAGVAMLFATLAGIYSQQQYGLNSLPFVLALVFSYILKDRIKEWLKQYFNTKMTRWLWDYDVTICDPASDTAVGRCREAFCYLDYHQVPPEVLGRRNSDNVSAIEADSKPEVVMKYEKDVKLHSRTITAMHGRLHDINDIIRFNIASFLSRTDDPLRSLRAYDADDDAVREIRCPKVYHVNVVLVLRAHNHRAPVQLERVRVVIDKRGIVRLEEA